MKQTSPGIHKLKDIPDHIIEESNIICEKILYALDPLFENQNSSMVFNCISRVFVCLAASYLEKVPEEYKMEEANKMIELFTGNLQNHSGLKLKDEK